MVSPLRRRRNHEVDGSIDVSPAECQAVIHHTYYKPREEHNQTTTPHVGGTQQSYLTKEFVTNRIFESLKK